MIHLSVTIGLSVLCLTLIGIGIFYVKEQQLIKIISFIFGLLMLLLLAGHIMTGSQECEIKLVNQRDSYTYGNNFTGYHWDYDYSALPGVANDAYLFHVNQTFTYERLCFETGSSIPVKTFVYMDRFLWILRWLLFFLGGYLVLEYVGVIEKLRQKFQRS